MNLIRYILLSPFLVILPSYPMAAYLHDKMAHQMTMPRLQEVKKEIQKRVKTAINKVQYSAVHKSLQLFDESNIQNKDKWVTKVFGFLSREKPELLGAMIDHYTKHPVLAKAVSDFSENTAIKREIDYNPSLFDEFAEVASSNISQLPLTSCMYLARHNEKFLNNLSESVARNITKPLGNSLHVVLRTIADQYGILNQSAASKDARIKKIISAAREKFSTLDEKILMYLIELSGADDFLDLTAKNITKKYSKLYVQLLNNPFFFINGYNAEKWKVLLPAIRKDFEHMPIESITSFLECFGSSEINMLTDNIVQSIPRLNATLLEHVLKNSSYKSRGRILNAIRDHLKDRKNKERGDSLNCFISDSEKSQLIELYNKYSILLYRPALTQAKAPEGLSQTEAHLYANASFVNQSFNKALGEEKIQTFVEKVHEQEKKEQKKDRLTFVHGCKWEWDMLQDIFTKLMEIKKNKSFENYRFLRFEEEYDNTDYQKDIRKTLRANGRTDDLRPKLLFMNHALFGNTGNPGSCTFSYWHDNHDMSSLDIGTRDIFKKCGFEEQYIHYKHDIDELERLHKNAEDKGVLLLLSVDRASAPQYIYPSRVGGHLHKDQNNVDDVIKTLKDNPYALGKDSDSLEYCMILTNDYALNPEKAGKDVKIYPFSLGQDALEYKEYCVKRDYLLSKIARDTRMKIDYSKSEDPFA